MPIYQSKPKYVNAYQYDGDFQNQSGEYYAPDWVVEAFKNGYLFYRDAGELYIRGEIVDVHVHVGDYLILEDDKVITCGDKDEFESRYDYLENEDDNLFRTLYLNFHPTNVWCVVDWRTFVKYHGNGKYECKYLVGDDTTDDIFHVINRIVDMNQWKGSTTLQVIEREIEGCTPQQVAVTIAQDLPVDMQEEEFSGTTAECADYMTNFLKSIIDKRDNS